MNWTPSREWAGRKAVVIAPGPSLTLAQVRLVALGRLADKCRVIAVNDAALVAWFADIAFAGDGKWWKARNNLTGFPGRRVALREGYQDAPFDCVTRIAAEGYDPRPGMMCTHGNSGAMAVQLAAHLGSESIALVGFDMRNPPNSEAQPATEHFFGTYEKQGLRAKPNPEDWVRMFRPLAEALTDMLVSATPGSALNDGVLPFMCLEEYLG